MPILHRQLSGQGTDPFGNIIAIPPGAMLISHGPILQVAVSLAQPMAQQLVSQGEVLEPPVLGVGLIDTGATSTCIDTDIANQLKLPVVDLAMTCTPSHDSVEQPVLPVHVDILGWGISFDVPRVIGASLANQGLLLLIGRDILSRCVLIYNRHTGEFTLAL